MEKREREMEAKKIRDMDTERRERACEWLMMKKIKE